MKLDPDLKAKLLANNPSLESAVDDACELLTMRVVLRLTKRLKELDATIENANSYSNSPEKPLDILAGRRKELGEIIVLLSETP